MVAGAKNSDSGPITGVLPVMWKPIDTVITTKHLLRIRGVLLAYLIYICGHSVSSPGTQQAALSPSKKINAQEDKRAYTSVEVPAGYTADWVGGRTDLGIVVISVKCLVDGNQANGYRLKIVSRITERL